MNINTDAQSWTDITVSVSWHQKLLIGQQNSYDHDIKMLHRWRLDSPKSTQSGTKEYHKVTEHNKFHTRVIRAAPAWARSSRELSRRQALYRISWQRSFPGWRFPGWAVVRFSRQVQGLVGFGMLSNLEVDFDFLPYKHNQIALSSIDCPLFFKWVFLFFLFCFGIDSLNIDFIHSDIFILVYYNLW